jgi:hypothetical protein
MAHAAPVWVAQARLLQEVDSCVLLVRPCLADDERDVSRVPCGIAGTIPLKYTGRSICQEEECPVRKIWHVGSKIEIFMVRATQVIGSK